MRRAELLLLQRRQVGTNLDDIVPRPLVHVWIVLLQVVQNVLSECTIPGPNLVYHEVFVREVLEQVFGDKAMGNSVAIMRLQM